MEANPIIDAARDQLRQGHTGQALRLALSVLETDRRYTSSLLRTLRVLEANYNAVREQELKGILSSEEARREYNKANNAILAVLDDLAEGRVPDPAPAPRSDRWWWSAAATLLVLVVAGVFVFRALGPSRREAKASPGPALGPAVEAPVACPSFDRDRLRVMILPFQRFAGEAANPEVAIQTRIRTLAGNNSFPVDIEVFGGKLAENSSPDIQAARGYGKDCDAELVIWGQYEKAGTGFNVNVHYAFIKENKREGATGFQKYPALSTLASRHMGLRDLEDAVFSICAIMAIRENNPELALKWLNRLKKPDKMEAAAKERLAGR